MTATQPQALDAMLTHHRALEQGVRTRVNSFVATTSSDDDRARAAAVLVAFLAGEVLPHARAEEETVYKAARAHDELAGALDAMIDEHHVLADIVGRLADEPGAAGAPDAAERLATLFSDHVAKENEVVLPALATDATADLAALVGELHRLAEAAGDAPGDGHEEAADPVASVLSLLLRATTRLARAGEADQACRLAASAWAALREPRPELAVRVTAALHGLSREVAPETVPITLSQAGEGVTGPSDTMLDVRSLAPAQRHQLIFVTYDSLAPGSGFVLVNDHDPKPLQYQFEAEHTGQFTWDTIEAGPTVWQVRIGRPRANGSDQAAGAGDAELDVRPIPHARRHDSIFTAYLALEPGQGFVLVNDHDPKPLRYQFEAQFAGAYTWDYLEAGPAIWRVRIGRPPVA